MNQIYEQFKRDLSQDILMKIANELKENTISGEYARSLALGVSSILKDEEAARSFQLIRKLSEKYPELIEIFIKRGNEYDERNRLEQQQIILATLKEFGVDQKGRRPGHRLGESRDSERWASGPEGGENSWME